MAALARWCFNHRYRVILVWVAALIALLAWSGTAGSAYTNSFSLPGTESTAALNLLKQSFPQQAGDTDSVVWHVDQGSVNDPAIRERVTGMLEAIAGSDHVTGVAQPYASTGGLISADGRTAYATVSFDAQAEDVPRDAYTAVLDLAKNADGHGLDIALGGNGIRLTQQQPPSIPTLVGIVAAAVILYLAFGSFLATLVPLISAILSLGIATSATGLMAHAFNVSTVAPALAALIGLGVGVDYALFVVTRHRNAIKAGQTPEDAAVTAQNTAGRAVIFAGITVCIALLGLLTLGVELLDGLAIPAAFTVIVSVLAACTLLPAMLGVLGMRVLNRRERRELSAQGPHEPTLSQGWLRWASVVQRRPVMLSAFALALVVVLTLPVFSVRLGTSDQGNDPKSWTTRTAYDLLADGFGPGFNGPLQVVAKTPTGQPGADALTVLSERIKATAGVASVDPAVRNAGGDVAILRVVPAKAPQSVATTDLITNLRDRVIPAVAKANGLTVHVGGVTATFDDFAHELGKNVGLFLAIIIVLGFVLLMVAYRSLVVPAIAAVMNLLAAAVTFGVMTALFQWGWLDSIVGLGGKGPIDPTMPVMLIAILFGLSMDYQVFLVSRMHEEWNHTHDNALAVRAGIARTGQVITAAALIMVLVFSSFALGGERLTVEFGIGLAIAVLFDAFVLRTVLVPAAMQLFGSANWWLPGWLDRVLPHLSVEPADDAPQSQSPAAQPIVEPIPQVPAET